MSNVSNEFLSVILRYTMQLLKMIFVFYVGCGQNYTNNSDFDFEFDDLEKIENCLESSNQIEKVNYEYEYFGWRPVQLNLLFGKKEKTTSGTTVCNIFFLLFSISEYRISANSFRTIMYCDKRSQYIRPNSKKTCFLGNTF